MPQNVKFKDGTIEIELECATEEELLDFANRLRTAGAADPLASLLPSVPGNVKLCLIAKAVNFQSEVAPLGPRDRDTSEFDWYMDFSGHGITPENALAIAAVCGHELEIEGEEGYGGLRYSVELPKLIGNAADAFDHKAAFTEFNNG